MSRQRPPCIHGETDGQCHDCAVERREGTLMALLRAWLRSPELTKPERANLARRTRYALSYGRRR